MTGYERSPDYGGPKPSRRWIVGFFVAVLAVNGLLIWRLL